MKLIVEPADGVAPLLAAIKNAKRSVDIAIFRFDHKAMIAFVGLPASSSPMSNPTTR